MTDVGTSIVFKNIAYNLERCSRVAGTSVIARSVIVISVLNTNVAPVVEH